MKIPLSKTLSFEPTKTSFKIYLFWLIANVILFFIHFNIVWYVLSVILMTILFVWVEIKYYPYRT